MPNFVPIPLRILAGIAGPLLLYVAFFLYEDEEARIQNRLEQIWKRIDALQSTAMSKEMAFLQGVTRTTTAILDRLLGHKLFSTQSISVSMVFSLGSCCLYLALVPLRPDPRERAFAIFSIFVLLILGALPAFPVSNGSTFRALRQLSHSRVYHLGLIALVILCGPAYRHLLNLYMADTSGLALTEDAAEGAAVLIVIFVGVFD